MISKQEVETMVTIRVKLAALRNCVLKYTSQV